MAVDVLIPGILVFSACFALHRRENVYDAMTQGAAGGLRLLLTIVPSLIVLLSAISMGFYMAFFFINMRFGFNRKINNKIRFDFVQSLIF